MIKKLLTYPISVFRNNSGKNDNPRFLTFITTFKCNAKCIMCDSWKKESVYELSIDEIEKIFRQLPELDAVRLSGGEPFTRKDFPAAADLAMKILKPFFLHITTNGFLTERIVEFCRKRDKKIPLQLLVSIDGMEERHNYIRGVEKAFEKATATIKELAPFQKEFNMKISVNQTIVDEGGVEDYHKLFEYLKAFGIHNNIVLAYDSSATYKKDGAEKIEHSQIGKFSAYGNIDKEKMKSLLISALKNLKSYSYPERLAKRYYLKGAYSRIIDNINLPNPKCAELGSHLRLYPDGTIPTCQFNSITAGSFREMSFKEIRAGAKYLKQRSWVKNCSGCWAECEIIPNAFYSGDIWKQGMTMRG